MNKLMGIARRKYTKEFKIEMAESALSGCSFDYYRNV